MKAGDKMDQDADCRMLAWNFFGNQTRFKVLLKGLKAANKALKDASACYAEANEGRQIKKRRTELLWLDVTLQEVRCAELKVEYSRSLVHEQSLQMQKCGNEKNSISDMIPVLMSVAHMMVLEESGKLSKKPFSMKPEDIKEMMFQMGLVVKSCGFANSCFCEIPVEVRCVMKYSDHGEEPMYEGECSYRYWPIGKERPKFCYDIMRAYSGTSPGYGSA
jgi:hypothetical protein